MGDPDAPEEEAAALADEAPEEAPDCAADDAMDEPAAAAEEAPDCAADVIAAATEVCPACMVSASIFLMNM